MTSKVFLVVDCLNSPGKVYAVFGEEKGACDFRDRHHRWEADVEKRTLLYGQHVCESGYIE
jgi:hypothetical protein